MSSEESYMLNSVFQSLRNPYTNINVVWATRLGYDKFTKALASVYSDKHPWWNKTNARKTIDEYPIKPLDDNSNDSSGYLFMLGLPCDHTGKKSTSKGNWYVGGENSWRAKYEKQKDKTNVFKNTIGNIIKLNVFPKGTDIPGNWAEVIWGYATTGEDTFEKLTDDGKAWIDKHLCPWPLWSGNSERRLSGKFCS